MILYDEDTTTRPENGWKKLNTLSHYNVPDVAQLSLIPKQSSIYNYMSLFPEKLDGGKHHHHQQKYETLNLSNKYNSASPPLSRATSPLNHEDLGTKVRPKVREPVKGIIALKFLLLINVFFFNYVFVVLISCYVNCRYGI